MTGSVVDRPRLLGCEDLLSREEVRLLLEENGFVVIEVIRNDFDSVLFRGPNGPRTGWLYRGPAGKQRVKVEDGFPAEPAYGLLPVSAYEDGNDG